MNITWDRETTGLLDETAIDYCSVPYKLRESFKTHCIVVEEHETGKIIAFYDGPTYALDGREYNETVEGNLYVLKDYQPIEYEHRPRKAFKEYILTTKPKRVVAHNQIQFDLLVGKLEDEMDYDLFPETWCDLPVEFTDTLVKAKCLNPDRLGGNSLDALSEKTGVRKINFRPEYHESVRFKHFAADMLYYCIRDVKANTSVFHFLEKEKAGWNWEDAIQLEKEVKFIITMQEHRGFKYDKQLAEKCIEELDVLLEERRVKIEPILPPKAPTKAFEKTVTPPATQFLKAGGYSAHMTKFVEKHSGKLLGENENSQLQVELFGKVYTLPLPQEALIKEVPATLSDSTHIKEWLVGLGWSPSEYQEKDLAMKAKKIRKTRQEFEDSVDKYVEQTLASSFCDDRCEYLETTPGQLKQRLLRTKEGKSCKVLTNPKFTKGQEKEICPNLEAMSEQFPYARDIVDYLTYKHRRNSILGGGLEWDEEEEAEKGFLAYVREDGRIPTPADSCGAATSRFKHTKVANIPRTTSLYGDKMRAQFCVDDDCYQIGYDFDSLEAKEEANYCWKYDGDKQYCNSLTMEKPNDVHTLMAGKISKLIKGSFNRNPAKSVKYACLPMHTKVLTLSGWKLFSEMEEGDAVITYNAETGVCENDSILAKHHFTDKELFKYSNKYDQFVCTEDHRWYGWKRGWGGRDQPRTKMFSYFQAKEIKQEHNIILTAPYVGGKGSVTPEEASFFGWVLSDGYYKWSSKSERTSSSFGKRRDIAATIAQSEDKYWMELEKTLADVGCIYHKYLMKNGNVNKVYCYKISSEWMRNFLDRHFKDRQNKHEVNWVEWVCGLSREALECFYEAFYLGDGDMKSRSRGEIVTQNEGNIFDAVVTAAQLLGKGRVTLNAHSSGNKVCRGIRTQRRKHITCQELQKASLGINESFCLTTRNGSFIIWQDDFIGFTGNCTYGATEKKVAKIIGEPLHVGTQVFNAFWEAALPLKMLKEKLKTYWETIGGKRFILGIDGRKVPTRSAHAILNSLFQSGGVICAKRAMVIHHKKMKAEGFIVDFFKDNWNKKQYCQQLIAYHDEAQLEVSKGLVKFKMFQTKEEAQAFKEAQKEVWSDIKDSPKGGFYVAYSRPGELASQAVRESGEYYKLNVELTAGYVIGKNWAMCH